MMLRPELSTWVSSVKFNNNFRAPLASSFCRWRSSSSLSPIVDLPRRSTMVTSSRLRVEIVRPTTSPSDLHPVMRSEEHTSELQSLRHLVCRLLLEKKKPHAVRPVLCNPVPGGVHQVVLHA